MLARLSLIAFTLVWPLVANGATILLKGQTEPVIGRLVKEDARQIVLRTTDGEGKGRDETFLRENIELYLPAGDAKRLASLSPSEPAAYRDYAEELFLRRRDPEARELAIRLYQIAAYLDEKKLGRAGLLGMIALARSEEEATRFRMMLFVIDPRASLDDTQSSPDAVASPDTTAASELLRAVRLLRTGRGPTARAIVEKPEVAKLLDRYNRILTRAEFNVAAGQTTLSASNLRQILLLELEMEAVMHPVKNQDQAKAALAWSRELQGKGARPAPVLSLETLTEFNPRQNVFREGKWAEP